MDHRAKPGAKPKESLNLSKISFFSEEDSKQLQELRQNYEALLPIASSKRIKGPKLPIKPAMRGRGKPRTKADWRSMTQGKLREKSTALPSPAQVQVKRPSKSAAPARRKQIMTPIQRRKLKLELIGVGLHLSQMTFSIPKASFGHLTKSMVENVCQLGGIRGGVQMTSSAMGVLQAATEDWMIEYLETVSLCANHAKRVTLLQKDFVLARRIRGSPNNF